MAGCGPRSLSWCGRWTARLTRHHTKLLRHLLDHIDYLDVQIDSLDSQVDELLAPYAEVRDRLCAITGVDRRVAEVILAEIGVDMSVFPHGCASGVVGRVRVQATTPRPRQALLRAPAKATCGCMTRWPRPPGPPRAAATACLSAQLGRIAHRRGKKRAVRAVAHSILVIVYHLIEGGTDYQDLGRGLLRSRVDTQRATFDLVRQLEALGHKVSLQPAA